ncbi:FAD-binding domain-containing protein [Variovorax sp. PCZ-1]|uniref:FAD-binding domain-containing protein n=1 Tax=Variovorax sp. PCZ-1 TaxID=2835533 RepID=UPI001BCEF105|nr:FAD-binding domain-containing protein [Variovorax sp. PCZ-1]MBS7807049.1 deoxyribodipyrimidine photolyase [Variovorax sp. PCZ-1]
MTQITHLGIPLHLQHFAPTREAALARIAAISPATYARTRNALDGAVSGLSPYLAHGIVSLPEVAALVASKHRLGYDDKLVFEWGWREFFHHVWERVPQPDDVLKNMRQMNLWRGEYADELPSDIREGRTGVPCIDAAVRQLYATGYLHNHARMWLASYCVHLRKVNWRAGADWLYAHLLDGDVPSNHLSWQWVASSFSSKPYLFNAENVAKYAPQSSFKSWISKGTVIDASYEALDDIARTQGDVVVEPGVHEGVQENAILHPATAHDLKQIMQFAGIESAQNATEFIANRLNNATGSLQVQLIHPWSLQANSNSTALRIGIIHTPAHSRLAWSEQRWRFVLTRMREVCDVLWLGDIAQLKDLPHWPSKENVFAQSTLFEGYRDALPHIAELTPAPKLFAQPQRLCNSFSKFYEQARKAEHDFSRLLTLPQQISLL